jgi:hypothetical protein
MGMFDPAPQEKCRCGHPATAHQHYRPGMDCSLCRVGACDGFKSAAPLTDRLRLRLRPSR